MSYRKVRLGRVFLCQRYLQNTSFPFGDAAIEVEEPYSVESLTQLFPKLSDLLQQALLCFVH